MERLPLRRGGWNFWDWEGRRIHYITAGRLQAPLLLYALFVHTKAQVSVHLCTMLDHVSGDHHLKVCRSCSLTLMCNMHIFR